MTLKEGDMVPDLILPTDGGGEFALHSAKGKHLVIYFYPKDSTPGCTAESCDFRDQYAGFEASNTSVIGVSKDGVKSHDKFKSQFDLPFSLLSDEDAKMAEAFGVWGERSMFGKKYMGVERSTFLIGPDLTVKKIWRKVKVPNHVDDVLDAID